MRNASPLEASGVFELERLELVDGELISKVGKNRPNVNATMLMLFSLAEVFGKEFVDCGAPIDVVPVTIQRTSLSRIYWFSIGNGPASTVVHSHKT